MNGEPRLFALARVYCALADRGLHKHLCTPSERERAIAWLREQGMFEAAERGRALPQRFPSWSVWPSPN